MTNWRVEVITSVERRRRWNLAEKEQLVAASLESSASVSSIAREAGLHPSQLYGWRRQLRARQGIGFAPVQIAADVAPAGLADCGVIEIEFASGARMQITGAVDPAMLTATVTALADGRRAMIPISSGVRVWIATGHTDMRRGSRSRST
jgi:transposase